MRLPNGTINRRRHILLLFLGITGISFLSTLTVLGPVTYWDGSTSWSFYNGTAANSGPVKFQSAFTFTQASVTGGYVKFTGFDMGTDWDIAGFACSSGDSVLVTAVEANSIRYTVTGVGTAETKVYSESTPTGVSGETSWSYNSATKLSTIITPAGSVAVEVRWDGINLLTLTTDHLDHERGDTVTIQATAELSHDSHSLGSGDNFTISGYDFTWDAGESAFITSITIGDNAQVVLDTFTSGYEATYGMTTGSMNGNSLTITWGVVDMTTAVGPSGSGGGAQPDTAVVTIPQTLDVGEVITADTPVTPTTPAGGRSIGPALFGLAAILGVGALYSLNESKKNLTMAEYMEKRVRHAKRSLQDLEPPEWKHFWEEKE